MVFTDAPAVEDHFVTGLPARVRTIQYGTSHIDARRQWEFTHHRTFTGNGETILVIQRTPRHRNGDIAFGQLRFVEFLELGTITGIVFINLQGAIHILSPLDVYYLFILRRLSPDANASNCAKENGLAINCQAVHIWRVR